MDLLQSGDELSAAERLRSRLTARPTTRQVAGLAAVVLLALAAGGLAVRDLQQDRAREAVRVDVALERGSAQSTTVGGVARGVLSLVVVNRREVPAQLVGLRLDVPGLQVLDVVPPVPQELAARASLEVRAAFVVADCALLALPGAVEVALSTAGGPVTTARLPVTAPDDAQGDGGVRLGACPGSALTSPPGQPTDIALRPSGGTVEREGPGASGVALVEVRNGGSQVQLLSLEAQVPGVAFDQRRLGDGRSLVTDEVVVLRLGFRIADCAALERTGQVLLRVERDGGVQELRLTAADGPTSPSGLDLRVVFDACGPSAAAGSG